MDSLQAGYPTPVSGITSPYQGTLPSGALVRCVMCATATWCQTLCLRRVWHKLQPPVFQAARHHSLVAALQCIFTCRCKMVVPSRQPSTFLAGTCTSPFGGSKTIFNNFLLQWPWVRRAFLWYSAPHQIREGVLAAFAPGVTNLLQVGLHTDGNQLARMAARAVFFFWSCMLAYIYFDSNTIAATYIVRHRL